MLERRTTDKKRQGTSRNTLFQEHTRLPGCWLNAVASSDRDVHVSHGTEATTRRGAELASCEVWIWMSMTLEDAVLERNKLTSEIIEEVVLREQCCTH